jgi:hypothetical protein
MTSNFFSPLSFVAVFGSGIRDPGWVKIRIRDKHPGSATLNFRKPDLGPHINEKSDTVPYPSQKQDPDLDPNLSEKQRAKEAQNEAEEGHSGALEAVVWSRNNEAADPNFDSGLGPGFLQDTTYLKNYFFLT